MLGTGNNAVRPDHTCKLFGAIVVGAFAIAVASTALAASPRLSPAEYKSLPVGTELQYDKFSCTIRRGKEFETLCVDFDGEKIRHFGQFQLFKDLPKTNHIATIAPLDCPEEFNWRPYSVRRVELKQNAQDALKSLWPLEVGKEAAYRVATRYKNSRNETQDPVTLRVTGTEDITVSGNTHRTYVVQQNVDRSVNCVASYKRTFWFDPALGVTVRERIEPTGNRRLKAKTSEIELVSLHFPPGTPAAAKPTPRPSVRQAAAAKKTTPAADTGSPFTAPPRGTVIEYDTWTCEVTQAADFVTECRDPEHGRVNFYGMIEPIGKVSEAPPIKAILPLMKFQEGEWGDARINVWGIALNANARAEIEQLWPLGAGKSARYEIDYDVEVGGYVSNARIKAETTVERTESLTIGDQDYETYVISQSVSRVVLVTRGGGGPSDNYRRTIWIDPQLGIIVKDRREWLMGYRKGKTQEYKLVNVTFPEYAPAIAQTAPQPPAAQPAPLQQPREQPKVAALPLPKPPVQKAVEVALDEHGPAIEVPSAVETNKAIIEIAGRVLDDSRIIEVRLDGRPVPMAADGTVTVRRGVPVGTTTFTLAAMDEWGNASEQSVTVTRAAADAPKVAAKPQPAPQPIAKVAADEKASVIELPSSLNTTERTIELAGRVFDNSKVVEVTVEGRPVALGANGAIEVKRAVSVGSNTIRIAAVDEWGNRAEKRITVERRRPFANINFGTYHAIVIGNNDYAGMPKLKSAVNDAQAVAQTLRQDYGFTVDLLLNATRSDIIGALAKVRGQLKANDNLLIYYAGHGVVDTYAEEGFWLPVDAEQENPANWVSNSDVTNMLRAIRAKHVMVVADSCYSGTLVRAVTAKINTVKEREAWLKKMVKKRTRTALVSGGLEPVIDSGGGQHSVFAKAFLDALRTNEDVLEAERLFSLIKRPVALESEQTPQYSDVRRAGHDGGDFLFVKR